MGFVGLGCGCGIGVWWVWCLSGLRGGLLGGAVSELCVWQGGLCCGFGAILFGVRGVWFVGGDRLGMETGECRGGR